MMTKWDTIQADVQPIIPSYWTDEEDEPIDDLELSLDELIEHEEKIVLDWESAE